MRLWQLKLWQECSYWRPNAFGCGMRNARSRRSLLGNILSPKLRFTTKPLAETRRASPAAKLYISCAGADTGAGMMELSELFGTGRATLLVGAVLLYVASRAGAHALAGRDESPGRRAVGNWLPI